MKNIFFRIAFVAVAVVVVSACAKDSGFGTNELNLKQYQYWVADLKAEHPEYLFEPIKGFETLLKLEEEVGDPSQPCGDADGDYAYVRIRYVHKLLDGTIFGYTEDTLAKQLGVYDRGTYYGPVVVYRGTDNIISGLDYAISTMNVGGKLKFLCPGWFADYSRYSTEQGYINNVTETNLMCYVDVLERIHNVIEWEVDSVCRYVETKWHKSAADSLEYGMYYKSIVTPEVLDTIETTSDIKINYIGRLLNGQVFDTTIEDTAKKYGIYDSETTYEPVTVNFAASYADVTMGSSNSTVIAGFAKTILKLHVDETVRGVFYSGLGYSYTGSLPSIPGFCPLEFDVQYVGKAD